MSQLFSNNVDTQLSAPLSDVGTSASVADGSKMKTPTSGDHELLTLISGTTVEIVRMTARTGNTITITRAQEGTTAIAWGTGTRVFAGITAATIAAMLVNLSSAADALAVGAGSGAGANSTALGDGANAEAQDCVSIGHGTWTPNRDCVAIGTDATALGFGVEAISIGSGASSNGSGNVIVGHNAICWSAGGVAVGRNATASDAREVCIGDGSDTGGFDSVAVGYGAQVFNGAVGIGSGVNADADDAIAIGNGAAITADHSSHLAALPVVTSAAVAAADCAWHKNAASVVIMSAPISLTATSTHTIPMPTGVTFYPDEVGVIVTAADTVTGQPTVRFGATGAETRYLAATETAGLTVARAREKFATLVSDEGSTTLAAEITIAGAATTLTGQFYWRGFAVQQ